MKARRRPWPLTVAKLPVATNRVPFGDTAMCRTRVSSPGLTTPATVMLMVPRLAPVVGFSALTCPVKFPAAMSEPLASLMSETVRMFPGRKVGSIRLLTRSYLTRPRRVMSLTFEKAPAMNSAVPSAVASMPPTRPLKARLSGEMTPVSRSKATKFCRA